ncbi:hypothetical Protein YC6258_02812 [Gynuella sunshinyii YC6258]|uniref:Uncharacterized protein n=1 Tax=Gynuella sunshinyii YC6258 TaxID=1445510 RepID=A0A0C5V5X1_9GAMM|nr:hypothetical Protein YC6258_02812 [Gynuella sunshinyii YC6258]
MRSVYGMFGIFRRNGTLLAMGVGQLLKSLPEVLLAGAV